MKKKILLPALVVLLFLGFRNAQAQRILGGISLGMNLTQVDGDQFYGFNKVGVTFGPMAIIPFGKDQNWSVSMELLYSQKGSYHRGSTDSTYYRLNLDYIDVPVMIHFTDKRVISAGIGICYGQLINHKESYLFITPDSLKTTMKPYDLSAVGEISVRLWHGFWFNARYQYSMLSLRSVTFIDPTNNKNIWERKQYNNVISIRLTYVFKQPLPDKKKKPKNNDQEE
jgi:hypothetical protein